MNTRFLFGAMALIAVMGAGCAAADEKVASPSAPAELPVAQVPAKAPEAVQSATSTSGVYTMADVEKANSATKCWTVVKSEVYDLTPAIDKHPGGKEAVLSLCGKDGSAAFEKKHGGQERPEKALSTLKIGKLK